MTKILIVNLHSSRNAGDAALTHVMLTQLQNNFPTSQFHLAMNEPESHTGPEQVVASFGTWFKDARTQRWHGRAVLWFIGALMALLGYRLRQGAWMGWLPLAQRALLHAYFDADIVVSCAGGFLYSSKNGLGLLNSLFTLLFAIWAGKPVYLMPQSIGPFQRSWEHWLVRYTLMRVRVIMVREPISAARLQAIGVQHPTSYTLPDLGFALKKGDPVAARRWLERAGFPVMSEQPKLGITLVDWAVQNPAFTHQHAYEAAVVAMARFFIQQYGGQVVLFPQVCDNRPGQDDRVPARRVAQQLAEFGGKVIQMDEPAPFPTLKAAYGMMDVLVGTRMHSNLFALTEGTPFLAISYQPKTEGIAKMVGLGHWVVPIEEATGERLITTLAQLWQARQALRQHLAQILPDLAAAADRAGGLIAQDYAHWR